MDKKFSKERRDVLKGACTVAGATAVMSVGVSMPAFATPQKGVPQVGDVFVFVSGPKKDQVVTVDDVVLEAAPITAQAKDPNGAVREGDKCTALLYRAAKDKVPSDMATETVDGVMAFSAMCTHQGCMIEDLHKPNEVNNTFGFICPCHDAVFDPLEAGKCVGGAESRTLPHFPIKSDGGKIVVSDVPSSYVGVKRGR
jgi:rieske iron-sulfur protein